MGLLDDVRNNTAPEPMQEDTQPQLAGWPLPDDIAEGAVEAYLRQFKLQLENQIKSSKSGHRMYTCDSKTVGLIRKHKVTENFRYEFSIGGAVHCESPDSRFARREGWWEHLSDGTPLSRANGYWANGLLEIYMAHQNLYFVCLYEDHVEQVVRMTEERLRSEGIQAEAKYNRSKDSQRLVGVSIRIRVPCDKDGNI